MRIWRRAPSSLKADDKEWLCPRDCLIALAIRGAVARLNPEQVPRTAEIRLSSISLAERECWQRERAQYAERKSHSRRCGR
jgi:hypothetical protein